MKRLRHPIRAIREPFGTAGLVVAMVALLAALGGTALAANGALSGKQRKEVEKIAKKFAGKPGAPGAPGAAGPAGAAGREGAVGKEGGVGKEGAAGKAGSNGTTGFTKTLPSGQTETGAWAVSQESEEFGSLAPISFSIPLAAGIEETHVFFIPKGEEEQFETECPGSVEVPVAAKGDLCVYTAVENGLAPSGIVKPFKTNENGAGISGADVRLASLTAEAAGAAGTWAVTAP